MKPPSSVWVAVCPVHGPDWLTNITRGTAPCSVRDCPESVRFIRYVLPDPSPVAKAKVHVVREALLAAESNGRLSHVVDAVRHLQSVQAKARRGKR